jgi:RNA polymerase sigma factor (TIGR02999 family)
MESQGEITALLASWRDGDQAALERLSPLIHNHLYRIARRHLQGERRGHTIQPSSLVQEVFLHLLPDSGGDWQNRAHFFAVASQVMRHCLVDHARAKRRAKRGGMAGHISMNAAAVLSPEQLEQVVAIDLALQKLEAADERKSKVFEMRFFGGLTVEEAAEALGVSSITVARDWNFGRAWLRRELQGAETE